MAPHQLGLPGLPGARVLVTGASRGIGAAIAEAFIAQGAVTHILAETEEVFTAAADLGATGHLADVTDQPAVARAMAAIGPVDVLVNNAGLERLTPVDAIDADSVALFRQIIDINLAGTAIVTGEALRRMPDGGRIVNTASLWGRVAEPLFGAYVASKHGVLGLTKTWARELGPRGVRVNAVCPGWVETAASLRSADEMAARTGGDRADVLNAVAAGQCLPGPVMQPADIAGAYLYLASDLSAHVTGQSLGVDRGDTPW